MILSGACILRSEKRAARRIFLPPTTGNPAAPRTSFSASTTNTERLTAASIDSLRSGGGGSAFLSLSFFVMVFSVSGFRQTILASRCRLASIGLLLLVASNFMLGCVCCQVWDSCTAEGKKEQ